MAEEFHFYASTASDWCQGKTVKDAKQGAFYDDYPQMQVGVWRVPGPMGSQYRIVRYAPVVEGRILLENPHGYADGELGIPS